MSKTTVKLSYSILNAWAHGQWEQAVGYYVGQPLPATPEMELGRVKHEQWEMPDQGDRDRCLKNWAAGP